MKKILPFIMLILPSQILAQTYSCQFQNMCELPSASCLSLSEEPPVTIVFSDEMIVTKNNLSLTDESVVSVYRTDGVTTYFTEGNGDTATYSMLSTGELYIFGFVGLVGASVMSNATCEAVQ